MLTDPVAGSSLNSLFPFFSFSPCNVLENWLNTQHTVTDCNITESTRLWAVFRLWKYPRNVPSPISVHLTFLQVSGQVFIVLDDRVIMFVSDTLGPPVNGEQRVAGVWQSVYPYCRACSSGLIPSLPLALQNVSNREHIVLISMTSFLGSSRQHTGGDDSGSHWVGGW